MADTDRSRLAIEWLDLGAPKRNARNPRKHSKAQINRLTKSIRTFGFNVPVLVDADGNVLAGHGRLLAAEKLGCREIPAIRIDHLTPAQAKAFTIADNRLADLSSWNDQLLAEVFNELAQVELNFDIDATGFDVGEIDVRIEGLESDNDDSWPDRLPTSCNAATISKLGDQWLLGKHVIRCDNGA
jgi:ParB-like chromosome segregation protein Spo0J